MSPQLTHDIQVSVRVEYVVKESDPKSDRYFFAYHITISNQGELPVQLMSREWLITNAHGATEVVKGAGVVGQQPHLNKGESFQYSSFCPLNTQTGTMKGFYFFERSDGVRVKAEIPEFDLVAPGAAFN